MAKNWEQEKPRRGSVRGSESGAPSPHPHHLHPSLGSSRPSKDFPAFLITPFSAPVFQEARGFFQCPYSPDSWQSFSLQGFLCFLILGVTKLETGKCDPISPAELGPARLGTS